MPSLKTLLKWLVVACFAALTLLGCWLLSVLKAPPEVVSVSDIQIKKTGTEYRIVVSLQVTNPNNVGFNIQSMSYGLELNVNDETFVQGAATGAFTLEPNSSIEVPVIIPGLTADMVGNLTRMLWICLTEGKPAHYRLVGTQTMKVPYLGLLEMPFSCTGSLQPSMQDKIIHYELKGTWKVPHRVLTKLPFITTDGTFSITDDISINKLTGSPPDMKKVSVSNIQFKATDGLAIDVSLMIPPNDVDLDLQGITCGLALNMKDKTFALGAATSAFTLDPNNSVEVPVKIRSLTANAVSDLAYILWSCIAEGEPAIYKLNSTLALNFHGAPVKVPFSSTGTLQLSIQGKAIHYDLKGSGPLFITGEIPLGKPMDSSAGE